MKKAISISLLLLANIVILAHAVIPHHHHDGNFVTLIKNYCSTNHGHEHDHNHDHNAYHDTTPHEHDCKDTSEQCVLNEAYPRPNNSSKIVCSINCDDGQSLFFVLPGILNNVSLADDLGLPFRQKPYIESYHVIFSSNSIGLRAPPVC